jgi:hypothetical protein
VWDGFPGRATGRPKQAGGIEAESRSLGDGETQHQEKQPASKGSIWQQDSRQGNRAMMISKKQNQTLTAEREEQAPERDTNMEVTVLPHLIGNLKIVFLAHFYTRNAKMKLGSDKEPQPSRVLYIGPSKRLNDYYAPRA